MACELVTTGWYASAEARSYLTSGADLIRGVGFRPLWWQSIDTYLKPEHVLVVDSASPVKADDAAYTSTKFQRLELLVNPGHAQNSNAYYSGWMAGMLIGLEFALASDVDLFIYVEQDVLLFGTGILDKTKRALRRADLVFGAGSFTNIQQSYVAANKKGIRHFLSALHAINHSDRQIAPEHKFMLAASRHVPAATARLAVHTKYDKLRSAGLKVFASLCSPSKGYAILPFGYGRLRPINFADEAFYFQHGTLDEIALYKNRTGF